MSEALSPKLEQKAQARAARLRIRADDTLLAMDLGTREQFWEGNHPQRCKGTQD